MVVRLCSDILTINGRRIKCELVTEKIPKIYQTVRLKTGHLTTLRMSLPVDVSEISLCEDTAVVDDIVKMMTSA